MTTTSTTPLGLIRFEKSIPTKRAGKCFFCDAPTVPGIDFAALDGKWIAVCGVHANSVVEQCKALITLIQRDAITFGLSTDDLIAINTAHAPLTLAEVFAGTADIPTAIAAAIKLTDALRAVQAHKPADAIVGKLTAVLAGTTATAWERDFCASVLDQINRGRTPSDKQRAVLARIIDSASTAPTPDTCVPEHGGIYVAAGSTFLVRESKAGRLYAMILASEPVAGCKLDWQYNAGGVNVVRRSGRAITAAEAAALGHITSFCCFCSLELSDERSVDAGYGPTCASNHGLPWG